MHLWCTHVHRWRTHACEYEILLHAREYETNAYFRTKCIYWSWKTFLVKKNFWSKKYFGLKKKLVENNFWSKTNLVKIFFWSDARTCICDARMCIGDARMHVNMKFYCTHVNMKQMHILGQNALQRDICCKHWNNNSGGSRPKKTNISAIFGCPMFFCSMTHTDSNCTGQPSGEGA